MLRKSSEELKKITTNVFLEDWAWLQSTYQKTGASEALRKILRAHKQRTQKRQAEVKEAINEDIQVTL